MAFLKNCTIFALSFFVLILSILLSLLYLINLPYKALVCTIARLFRPELGETICDETACFHYKGKNLAFINNFWVLQGEMILETLTKHVAERITEKRNPDGTFLFHRLREYYSEFMGFDFWRTDTKFNVSNHVHSLSIKSITSINTTGMTFDKKLEKLTSAVVSKSSWKENQSPWEMFLVRFPEEDRTVFITRIHHSLADGWSHRFLFECLFQYNASVQPPTSPPTQILRDFSLRALLLYPFRMLWDVAEASYLLTNDPNTLWQKQDFNNVDCITAYSKPIRNEDIKRIRKRYGVDYNTVLFSAVRNAFNRVMEEAGQKIPSYSSLLYAGPKSNHPRIPTNHTYAHYLPLRSKDTSLEELNRHVQRSKTNLFTVWSDMFAIKMWFSLPIPFKKLQSAVPIDPIIVVSPFIPYDVTVFDGHRILDFVAFLGYRPSRTVAQILFTGSLDQMRYHLVMSKAVAPDETSAQRFVDYAWEEIQKMTMELKD